MLTCRCGIGCVVATKPSKSCAGVGVCIGAEAPKASTKRHFEVLSSSPGRMIGDVVRKVASDAYETGYGELELGFRRHGIASTIRGGANDSPKCSLLGLGVFKDHGAFH